MKTLSLILPTALIIFVYCLGPVPDFIGRCDIHLPSFNQCLSDAIQHAIIQLKVPIPDYDLPVIDPFKPGHTAVYGNSKTGLRQTYSNIEIFGFTNINSTSASFSRASEILAINVTFNDFFVTFDYRIRGRFITIPVDVLSRNSSLHLVEPTFELVFYMYEVRRNGVVYFRAVNSTLNMVPKRAIFNYTRVFDNQSQNDALNARINQNGNEAFDYLQKLFPQYFTVDFQKWFNNVLELVPAKSFFV
ncbi:uncharacterized protein LOC135138806 [Zophobas morio]|uniref:uncharacterized protein LOC135138806 n=1 Tax=Zophobas morio TaxID=2755281 RepID=UPI003082DDFA